MSEWWHFFYTWILILIILVLADEETADAFEKHFENQINLYKEQVIVNLINQSGRERVNNNDNSNTLCLSFVIAYW